MLRTMLRAVLALGLAALLVGAGLRYAAPEMALAIALDVERGRSGLVARRVELPGGLHIAYLEGGQGEPLVLLHGFGADKDNFTPIGRHLVGRYRVIVPDLVGFGDSSHPADADYAPLAQAERLSAFLRALGLRRAHVGGSSMGGQIALSWAAWRPDEVQSLWLLDPAGLWSAKPSEVGRTFLAGGPNPMLVGSVDEFDALVDLVMAPPQPRIPRFLQDAMARQRIRNRPLEERVFKAIAADSIEARIAGCRTPTLIVFGELDRVIDPATAPLLKGLLPRSQVLLMPGVGHLPALERPAEAAADYLRFRASLPP